MKAMPASCKAALEPLLVEPDLHAESAVSTSAAPDFDEAARLPCLATVTPQAATINEASVETFQVPDLIASRADDVDRAFGRIDPHHAGAHGLDGSGNLLDGLAANPQPHQKGAGLSMGDLTGNRRSKALCASKDESGCPVATLARIGLNASMARPQTVRARDPDHAPNYCGSCSAAPGLLVDLAASSKQMPRRC